MKGEGPYDHKQRQIVYSVISSTDSRKVLKVVREKDPAAFVNVMNTERISGRFYHKPNE